MRADRAALAHQLVQAVFVDHAAAIGADIAAGIGGATIGYQVIDKATGLVVPFLPGAEQILKPTAQIGVVAAELKTQIAQEDLAERLERTTAMLRAAGSLFEIDGEVA